MPPSNVRPGIAWRSRRACAGDPDLRGEVESLLSEDVSHEGMLDRPPVLVNGNRTQSSDSQPGSGN